MQRLYEAEYQQLFLLKSKVFTILESESDCCFSIKDYPLIWQLSSKPELSFTALSYISLIKNYLSKKECDFIESMGDKRLNDKGFYMGLYGMLAIIKLNLYLYRKIMP